MAMEHCLGMGEKDLCWSGNLSSVVFWMEDEEGMIRCLIPKNILTTCNNPLANEAEARTNLSNFIDLMRERARVAGCQNIQLDGQPYRQLALDREISVLDTPGK